ncbi:XRE family transcriptional regulator [Macrococcus brunensis]|uniref:XRE family transcriptional regulator n=1 Tax=Macrococcus brunensis TaxID=198483 RepID=A0A4R6BFJ7_9STAP|nr:XRE family transcriptional regulator [Macrococcus brunensis]TDL98523.1 XRE family transcriptional regulator [Macrococcus brunensis]
MIKVKLKEILKERNMTLNELSQITGISAKTLSLFQNKKTESVHYKTLEKIAIALNIEIGDIIVNKEKSFLLNLKTENIKDYEYKATLKIQCVEEFQNEYEYETKDKEYFETDLYFDLDIYKRKNYLRIFINIKSLDYSTIPYEFNIEKFYKLKGIHEQNLDTSLEENFLTVVSYLIAQNILIKLPQESTNTLFVDKKELFDSIKKNFELNSDEINVGYPEFEELDTIKLKPRIEFSYTNHDDLPLNKYFELIPDFDLLIQKNIISTLFYYEKTNEITTVISL